MRTKRFNVEDTHTCTKKYKTCIKTYTHIQKHTKTYKTYKTIRYRPMDELIKYTLMII